MRKNISRLVVRFFKYIRESASNYFHLIKDHKKYITAASYYSECDLKSKFRIFIDQVFFIFRYGKLEEFYFLYGFDRNEMTFAFMKEYMSPYNRFSSIRDRLNLKKEEVYSYNYAILLRDKFYFERFLHSLNFPTPLNNWFINNGVFINLKKTESCTDINKLLDEDKDAFVKPISGQCGEDIFHLEVRARKIYKDGKLVELSKFKQLIDRGQYIIQERVIQHEHISKLNPGCVNTIRIQTVRNDNEVKAFGAGIRLGASGNIVDNWAAGGVFVGIELLTGKLQKYGFLKPEYGGKLTEHPSTGIEFEGYQIPFFKEVVNMATKLHSFFYGIHSIGWDIAITSDGPVFIEGNNLWEISLVQASHGGLKKIFDEYFKYN